MQSYRVPGLLSRAIELMKAEKMVRASRSALFTDVAHIVASKGRRGAGGWRRDRWLN